MAGHAVRTAIVNGKELPVVDAKEMLTFTVTEKDVKHADPRSPKTCAFAVAIRRITNADSVCIGHKFAYVPWDTDGDGEPDIVRRYMPELKATKVIEDFDKTGKFRAGEYRFNPPSKTAKLGSWRARKNRSEQRQQKVKGRRYEKKKTRVINPQFVGVRNMTGMVHFILNNKKATQDIKPKVVNG